MAAAYDRGFFDDLVTPFSGCTATTTSGPTPPRKVAKLRPVFGVRTATPAMTAGNSTPLVPMAARCAASRTEEWAAERKAAGACLLRRRRDPAVDYVNGDDGLLMAPTYAVPRCWPATA